MLFQESQRCSHGDRFYARPQRLIKSDADTQRMFGRISRNTTFLSLSAVSPQQPNPNIKTSMCSTAKKTHLFGKQLQVMLRFTLGMFIVLIVISHTVREKRLSVCRDLHGRKTHLSTNCCVGTFSAEHTQKQWNQPESWHQLFAMRPVSTVKYHI